MVALWFFPTHIAMVSAMSKEDLDWSPGFVTYQETSET